MKKIKLSIYEKMINNNFNIYNMTRYLIFISFQKKFLPKLLKFIIHSYNSIVYGPLCYVATKLEKIRISKIC